MELWDLYSRDRQRLGRTHVRGEPIPEDAFHLVVHVWLRNSRGQYLISRRAADRPAFPLMGECTGGSVLAGEESLTGALRETREELGISLDPGSGRLVFSKVRDWVDGVRFGDILDVWLFDFEGEPDLDRAEGEAEQARWMDRKEIAALYEAGEMVETLGYFFEDNF